jgi:hypothetical protein
VFFHLPYNKNSRIDRFLEYTVFSLDGAKHEQIEMYKMNPSTALFLTFLFLTSFLAIGSGGSHSCTETGKTVPVMILKNGKSTTLGVLRRIRR